jgi:iron complex outermembrane receptor protein
MGRIFFMVLLAGLSLEIQASGFQDGSVIKGRVTDQEGNPLPGTSVTITRTFLGAVAGTEGTYSVAGLKDGLYTVRFSFVGFKTVTLEVNLLGEAIADAVLEPDILMAGEVIINALRAGNRTPVAFSDISDEELLKNNLGRDLPFILSLTPSLVETSESGNGIGYTAMRIRGTEGNRINVTIDGIPLNDPESQQVFWVDLPDLASSVDNIQIQRGAGTSTNGAGAFGASINIQTRSPDNKPFAETDFSAGSFGTFKTMAAAGTGLLSEKFALQMRYSTLKSDGYIERTGSDHRSAFITGIYSGNKSGLKANIILGEEKTRIGWWGVPQEMLSINRRYNPAGEYTDQNGNTQYYDNETDNYIQNHFQLIYNLKANNTVSLQTALHYTRGKGYYEEYREDRNYVDYGLLPLNINGTGIYKTDMIRRKWMSNDFYGMVWSVNYNKERISAVLGGGANRYIGDHFGRILWMAWSGNYKKDYQWYLNTGIKGEVNIYGKLTYSLTDRVSLFGDLQYRYIRYRLDGQDDDLKEIGQEHGYNFFNPKTGIFFNIDQNQDLYYSFSVANREPTRTDFKEAAGDDDATPLPERLFDHELGYRFRRDKISADINFYSMLYRNQLVPTGELSDVGYPIMTNVISSYRIGVELSAGFRPLDFLEWRVNTTISRNRIRNFIEYYTDYNTSDWSSEYRSREPRDVDIAYSPRLTGTSDLAVKTAPWLKIHFISKYVGMQYFDNTMSSERRLSPYLVNNLRIDFEPITNKIRAITIQLLINNLFNTEYESNAYGGNWYEDGNEKTWAYYFPQAGINYMLRLSVKF